MKYTIGISGHLRKSFCYSKGVTYTMERAVSRESVTQFAVCFTQPVTADKQLIKLTQPPPPSVPELLYSPHLPNSWYNSYLVPLLCLRRAIAPLLIGGSLHYLLSSRLGIASAKRSSLTHPSIPSLQGHLYSHVSSNCVSS